jgi:hypothetical protein
VALKVRWPEVPSQPGAALERPLISESRTTVIPLVIPPGAKQYDRN